MQEREGQDLVWQRKAMNHVFAIKDSLIPHMYNSFRIKYECTRVNGLRLTARNND